MAHRGLVRRVFDQFQNRRSSGKWATAVGGSKPSASGKVKVGCSNYIISEISNSMSTQCDPLKPTSQELHRFWFMISSEKQWYDVIREARAWFGKNWQGMSKVRRKLTRSNHLRWKQPAIPVWFDVPDERFASWCSVKFSLQVMGDEKYQATK